MPVDMKEQIAESARRLLAEKRIKKLTVKEIVEECGITRQSFYYHFEDIPDMFRWMLKSSVKEIEKRCDELPDMESRFRYLFVVSLNAEPYMKQGLKTNYGNEIEACMDEIFQNVMEEAARKNGVYEHYTQEEAHFRMRYHCGAMKALMRSWTDEDTERLEYIVRQCCQVWRESFALAE